MGRAQPHGEFGFALQAHTQRVGVQGADREHLPPTLKTEVSGLKGKVSTVPFSPRQTALSVSGVMGTSVPCGADVLDT
ncbi:hypothetical protein GCM10025734_06320 [Kitasatospora paranensis]